MAGATPSAPELQNGDRVGFIGDSITDIGHYHSYLQLFYATRFPDREIQYFPAGHSGGTADDCLRRLNWDILARSPNIATVNFGMNDMGGTFGASNASPEEMGKAIQERMKHVQNRYETLLDALSSNGVRLILIGPSIYDGTVQIGDSVPPGTNRLWALGVWTQGIKDIAASRKAGFVDLWTKMKEVNARLQAADPKATIVGQDRVHPGEAGNMVMLYSILKAQGIGPDVAEISVDAAKGETGNVVNCTVAEIERQENGIAFVCRENALPFPIPYRAAKALEWVPFTEELNRETLVVKNLPAGDYDLRIDGAVVGQYNASELASGLNLSLNSKTPQFQQSQKILQYNDTRSSLERKLRYLPYLRHCREAQQNIDWDNSVAVDEFLRGEIRRLKSNDYFRHIAIAYLDNVSGKTDAIIKQVDELNSKIRTERMPQAHKFALTLVK